jgi:signal transduction histidine kinase
MLRHVLDNLIGNALKYVPPGRPARIDVTASDAAEGWVRVEVADRGIGIPDGDKPDVFDSFHRSRTAAAYAGTGLGLAICRRIVERHGGAIGVADNPGGGTRIHFTLPQAAHAAVSGPSGDEAGDRAALDRAVVARAQIERSVLPVPPPVAGAPVTGHHGGGKM